MTDEQLKQLMQESLLHTADDFTDKVMHQVKQQEAEQVRQQVLQPRPVRVSQPDRWLFAASIALFVVLGVFAGATLQTKALTYSLLSGGLYWRIACIALAVVAVYRVQSLRAKAMRLTNSAKAQ